MQQVRPGREPQWCACRHTPGKVCAERKKDVTDEELICLFGVTDRRQHRHSKMGNRGVVERHGLMDQIADTRNAGIVGYRMKRGMRQIKEKVMVRLVQECNGISPQIMQVDLANTEVANRHLPTVLPVLTIGKVAKCQCDQVGFFPLDRLAQLQDRVVAMYLSGGHVGGPQYARHPRARLLGRQPLRESMPIPFSPRDDRTFHSMHANPI
jgi:hypothetical protein